MPAPTINLKLTHAQAVQLSQLLSASAAVAADLCMKASEAGDKEEQGYQFAAVSSYSTINAQLDTKAKKAFIGW